MGEWCAFPSCTVLYLCARSCAKVEANSVHFPAVHQMWAFCVHFPAAVHCDACGRTSQQIRALRRPAGSAHLQALYLVHYLNDAGIMCNFCRKSATLRLPLVRSTGLQSGTFWHLAIRSQLPTVLEMWAGHTSSASQVHFPALAVTGYCGTPSWPFRVHFPAVLCSVARPVDCAPSVPG